MINRLVINGCSYMNYYSQGDGHIALAQQLGIEHAESLAVNSSCNRRIIRTTIRDSYTTTQPTLYILGTTFLTRYELPALLDRPEPDGKWVSFTGSRPSVQPIGNFDIQYTKSNLVNFSELYNKFTGLAMHDLAEDLMFSLLSLIDGLHNRGHKILVFNTAENTVGYFIDHAKFELMRQRKEIVKGWQWRSIPWQFEQGASYPPEDEPYPADCRHVSPGQHRWLNEFLTNYIREYKIL